VPWPWFDGLTTLSNAEGRSKSHQPSAISFQPEEETACAKATGWFG
jgi:hypothetical protein